MEPIAPPTNDGEGTVLSTVRGLRYLLVDDSPVIRLVLRGGLEKEGIPPANIVEAGEGTAAFRAFQAVRPQVVFMDLTLVEDAGAKSRGARTLPREGGEQVARRMMAADPRVRIVVCTGASIDDPRVQLLVRLGAFYVLLKPVQSSHLRSLLTLLEMDLRSAAPAREVVDIPGRAAPSPAPSQGRVRREAR